MAVNLVELAKGYLTPDIMQKAASFVGESEPATQKAVSGIVPTLIAAMANQTSTTGGAEKLTRILDSGQVRRQRAQQPGIPVLRRRDDTESHHPRQGYSELSVRQQDRGPGGSDRALRRSSHRLSLVPIGSGRTADPEPCSAASAPRSDRAPRPWPHCSASRKVF